MTHGTPAKTTAPCVALVGDYSPDVPAHRAIPAAFELARQNLGRGVRWRWMATPDLREAPRDLAGCDAVWLVPASPYANMTGALDAVRWARETNRPFLGTCGGFQHALIEIARNVANLPGAEHAESNAGTETPLMTSLSCPLVGQSGAVRLIQDSRLRQAFGRDHSVEGYHCSYGLNAVYRERLESAGVRFTAFDDAGEVRAFELAAHPFFIGTLFQPERSALRGDGHPLIREFVEAVWTSRSTRT